MRPRELIMKWIEIFNEGNADEVAELYHPDAVNHQVANQPVEGRDNIRKMFAAEFATADMTCIAEKHFCRRRVGNFRMERPAWFAGLRILQGCRRKSQIPARLLG